MELQDALEQRRSYRAIEPCEINPEIIEKLATAASLAPSCRNNQPWRFVFVSHPESLKELKQTFAEGNIWAHQAALVIAVCSKKEFDCINPDGRENYWFDTGMATGFLLLKATEMGLTTHPIGGFNLAKAKTTLKIPEDVELQALIIVGKKSSVIPDYFQDYQKENELKRPERKPIQDIAYLDEYGESLLL